MIRGINIAINAAHPELPLVEATTFVGSPSSVFVHGVPKSCGNWRITAVSVAVTYPDNTTTARAAVESAQGVWVATIPGTATSGRTIGGFRILADGEDENGAAVTGYVLGFADFAVFSMLPVPAPGETFYLFRYFDAQPATPKKGDAAIIGGALKYYNGAAWAPFADDYTGLANKPSINSVALAGNKTGAQLGLANSTDLTPLQLAALYPEGDVKSASEWATPWNGSTGIKYELDTATHTAAILTFSKTTNTANDNSHLTGRVVIPPFIESNGERYTVTSIKDNSGSLASPDLTEVVAPTTLTKIGKQACAKCLGLKRAYFPRATQLNQNAFDTCRALEYVSIPNVSNIPAQCFWGCSSLKVLTIPNAESILLGGLSGCAALEVVNFGSVARSAVPTFYNNSFNNVPETCKIIIPDSQYTAWTTASGWSALVTAGYKFLRHSEWEYARRYELAAKQDALSQTQLANIAAVSDALAFDATYLYAAGDPVVYNGTLYTFTAAHTGAWTGSDVSAVDIIARLADKLDKSGGTVTGALHIRYGLLYVESSTGDAQYIVDWMSAFDAWALKIKPENSNTPYFIIFPNTGGTLALTAGTGHTGNLAALDARGNPADAGWTAGELARYSLVAKTIDNGAVTLDDRAINAVAVSSSLASLTVNFPTATSGKARDFGLRLTVASGITTAPELALPQGVVCENADGEAPEIGADGAATILYFTETASGVFLVKGEVVQTIS